MGSNQRKKILMIADLLAGSEPALHDMALGAVGAEFPQMNIGMAIGAVLSDVGEDGAGVALRAFYFFMHATKRVSRVVVIELESGAKGLPICRRVAIVAGNFESAMGIWRGAALRRRGTSTRVGHQ